tara:strand:- start:1269 stop:3149 length:1881 start_codon:yes stop_codon:yes gene_type:complete
MLLTAQTNVSGLINSDTNWSFANSPYLVTGNVLINTGVTLTIEPGVVVKMGSQVTIQNKGRFIAIGEPDNRITFTSNAVSPLPGDWTMIEFTNETVDAMFDNSGEYISGSIIQYADVLYGGFGTSFNYNSEGAIMIDAAAVFIDNVSIKHSVSQSIYLKNGTKNNRYTKISNSIMSDGGRSGIRCQYYGMGMVVDSCSFMNLPNGRAIYSNDGDSIIITNNFFTNISHDYVIYTHGDNNSIKNNILYSNTAGGIEVYGSSSVVACNKIVNCIGLMGRQAAIHVIDCDTVRNNLIVNCSGGVSLASFSKGNVIRNNQFIDNEIESFSPYPKAVLNIESSTSTSSDVYFLENLILNNSIAPNEKGLINIEKNSSSNNTSSIVINENNFLQNTQEFFVRNERGNYDVDASSNWWGRTSTDSIESIIYDWFEDANNSFVNYQPILSGLNISAPISPPTDVTKEVISGGVRLSWLPNLEPDIAGYTVHFGDFTGYSFSYSVDVGSLNTYDLTGANINDTIAVTSYDISKNGSFDQCDGNESWFAYAVYNPVTGLNENEITNKFFMYPNPASNIINILKPADSEVIIMDLTGKTLVNSYDSKIDVSNLSDGLYIVKIYYQSSSETKKILIEK